MAHETPAAAEELLRRADELDARRRHQIANQVSTINRLLNGGTYEEEIQALHEELAAAQAEADDLREKLEEAERRAG